MGEEAVCVWKQQFCMNQSSVEHPPSLTVSQLYLDCREEDLIDSSLIRRADVLHNVCPVHKGTVDGPSYVGRGQDEHIWGHLDLVKLSQ